MPRAMFGSRAAFEASPSLVFPIGPPSDLSLSVLRIQLTIRFSSLVFCHIASRRAGLLSGVHIRWIVKEGISLCCEGIGTKLLPSRRIRYC